MQQQAEKTGPHELILWCRLNIKSNNFSKVFNVSLSKVYKRFQIYYNLLIFLWIRARKFKLSWSCKSLLCARHIHVLLRSACSRCDWCARMYNSFCSCAMYPSCLIIATSPCCGIVSFSVWCKGSRKFWYGLHQTEGVLDPSRPHGYAQFG